MKREVTYHCGHSETIRTLSQIRDELATGKAPAPITRSEVIYYGTLHSKLANVHPDMVRALDKAIRNEALTEIESQVTYEFFKIMLIAAAARSIRDQITNEIAKQ